MKSSRLFTTAALSMNSGSLLTASSSGELRLSRVDDPTAPPLELTGHASAVVRARFVDAEAAILSAGEDGTARLWDATTGKSVRILDAHGAPLTDADASAGRVLTADERGAVRLWDVATGAELAKESAGGLVTKVSLSSAAATVEVAGGRVVRFDVVASEETSPRPTAYLKRTGPDTLRPRGKDGEDLGRGVSRAIELDDGIARVSFFAGDHRLAWRTQYYQAPMPVFSPEGSALLANGVVRARDGSSIADVSGTRLPNDVGDLFSRAGTRALRCDVGYGGDWASAAEVILLETETWKKVGAAMQTPGLASCAFAPRGDVVAIGNADGIVRLFRVDEKAGVGGEPIATIRAHEHRVRSLAFTPEGESVFSVSGATAARWAVATGKREATFEGHAANILSARGSRDGARLLTASADRTACLWEARSGSKIACLIGHTDSVLDAAFSPDEAEVLTASADGSAKLWDGKTGKPRVSFDGHDGMVLAAAFSPTGKRVATAGRDGTVRVWAVSDGAELAVRRADPSWAVSVAFDPSGVLLASGSASGVLSVWDVGLETRSAADLSAAISERRLPWVLHDGVLTRSK